MGTFLDPEDLAAFTEIEAGKAQAMIEDAESLAVLAAPCIAEPEFLENEALAGAVRAILRGVILRWHDTGSGAITQTGAGSFQQTIDTRSTRRSMFWPSEIDQLRALCVQYKGGGGGAYTINMTGVSTAGNPLTNAVINAYPGYEPWGEWSDDAP